MNDDAPLRLGTRGSPLARWQADWVADQLTRRGFRVERVLITTQGDVKTGPLGSFGGVGVFTKEIQRALLDRQIDLAVHSLKDLPTEPVPGLTLAAVPPREAPGDVLVSRHPGGLEGLPPAARLGTGSTRRKAQLLHVRPDLRVEDIRGNVETRLGKLDAGEYDAIVLAEAGLTRLGMVDRIQTVLPKTVILPAIGQGALGLETRDDDARTQAALRTLDDPATHQAVLAERAFLATLRGGCLAPVGGWAQIQESAAPGDSPEPQLQLEGVVLSPDGRRRLAGQATGAACEAELLGRRLAEELLAQGALELIQAARTT
ncbi:MAG: hydroxymethylbilane synthase [Pirellulales bacterium]